MAWNFDARPSGHRTSTTDKWRNVFHPGEDVVLTLSAGDADFYEVRNYYGTIVSSGPISGSTITLTGLPLGWYKIYYVRPTAAASPWFTAGGEDTFVIARSGGSLTPRPAFGTARVNTGGDPRTDGHDIPARAFAALGPSRLSVPYSNTGYLTGAGVDADYFTTWWTQDSARPAKCFASFDESYGLVDDPVKDTHIANAVSTLYPKGVTMYEGFNEPNNFGSTAANTITQLGLFNAQIKAANPSAQVMGPCTLSVAGTGLTWTRDVLAGAGSNIDVISFHNYNGGQGDLPAMRRVLDRFEAVLVATGQQSKPRFNTEFGSAFNSVYGSFEPRLQAQWVMLEMHMLEQYGVPKERTCYFYDWGHGFWSFPSFWILNDTGEPHPGPLMALVRIWSDEIAGKTFSTRLDFGSEDDHWLGSRFTGSDGSAVVTLQSGGRRGQVTLEVTGATSVQVVDPFGTVSTQAVAGGVVTLDVDTLPIYVRCPSGVVATPAAVDYGIDAITGRGCSATASSSLSPASNAINGSLESAYTLGGDQMTGPYAPFHSDSASGLPAWWELTFPHSTRFDRVVVWAPPPWQQQCSLLDFDIQIWDGSAWQVVATDTEETNSFQWTSYKAMGAGYGDSFYSRRNVFVFELASAVETTKLRVHARDVTAGGGAVPEVKTGYAIPGAECGQTGDKRLSLRQVQVFLSGKTDGGTAVAGQPMLALRGA